jgi:peroxiredoxin
MISKGQEAPDFAGRLADGGELQLSGFRGSQPVILYFFARDFTPG